ncbi:MAG: hypothetical protein FJX77_17970, partial [Armatimonadetes bacterium]|nr:hypothetical protein [Armatimonadota bacterium]
MTACASFSSPWNGSWPTQNADGGRRRSRRASGSWNSGVRSALFDYELPPERIAQTPIEPRDASRLLVLRADGSLESRRFRELPELLSPGDLLVLNDTRVLPARLRGVKLGPGGEPGARVELLLLRRQEEQVWEALVHPGRRVREGARLQFSGSLGATVLARGEEGLRTVRLEAPPGTEAPEAWVERALHAEGQVPLPPYIHTELDNPERYQTVYARHEGSAAAPTAGLHFTPAVFDALRERGVGLAWITLHVGLGTFRPLQGELLAEHRMHEEWCSIPDG